LYGLAGLIERLYKNGLETSMHINYHALEQQDLFLKTGLEFWQEYISGNHPSSNTFWRLDSSNLFDYYKQKTDDLPVSFFDFIVICHCFFWNADRRATSSQIYADIFQKHLAKDGYVVLIIRKCPIAYKRMSVVGFGLGISSAAGIREGCGIPSRAARQDCVRKSKIERPCNFKE
jgi:hypothetical protein